MKFHILFFIFIASFLLLQAQTASPNFRIYPSQVTQTEPSIAVSPVDPMLLFASAVTFNVNNGFRSEGVYVSMDDGQNWLGSDTCTGELMVNHGGDPGVVISPNGRLVLTHIGAVFSGMFSHYSDDLGEVWSSAYTITSEQPEDKGSIIMDSDPESPYYGRIYAAWVNFVSPFPLLISYSTNNGESWTLPAAINNPPPQRCSGGSIVTDAGGKVYTVWTAVEQNAPFIEDFAGFASSNDGGSSWNADQNIFDMNGINGTLPSKSDIRVNGIPQLVVDKSGGSRQGWIYIVTTERNLAPAGSDADIILHRSTDGGATWSAGIRVNQDPINNGKIQYFPAMDIDQGGGLNIIFYDDRNTASDSAEVFLARSEDGGDTWREQVISDHRFKPKPILGGSSNYQGDHIALMSVGDKLYALWMDDFSGIYQVWLAIINIEPNAIRESKNEMPSAIQLYQNYPNPFNPVTNIGFKISSQTGEAGFELVSLRVYNVTGQEAAVLVNKKMSSGEYWIQWNAEEFASGIYYYRLMINGVVETKKLVLLK